MPKILDNYDIVPADGFALLQNKRTGEKHAAITGNSDLAEATKEAERWDDAN